MSSKIKVDTIENVAGSGNVSLGSGHNLVVPGNITGQGTAAITSNATVGGTLGVTGVSTFSGNIGKVSSGLSPDIDFHIKTASGNPEARVESTGANYATYGLKNSSRAYSTQIRTDQSNSYVVRDETGGGNRLLISTAGAVTMPSQPMFALKNTGNSTHYKQATVQINQGSNWDNVNGRFTAPIAGKYFFFGGLQSNGAGAFYWGLYKNGTLQTSFYNDPSGGTYLHASVAQIISLAASDYVEFKMAGSQAANTGGQNHFSGFLIG